MEPATLVTGIPAFLQATRAGFARFRRWKEGDNFKRLERLLRERFESHEFLAATDWSFLQRDADAVAILDDFFVDQAPLRPRLTEVVADKLDVPSDAAPPIDQLAAEVVTAIESVANEIWSEDGDRVIFELRRLFWPVAEQNEAILELLAEVRAQITPQVLSFSDAAEELRGPLERLAEEDAALALKLHAALLAGRSTLDVARGLIIEAPSWTLEGPAAGSSWRILGSISARHGEWDLALEGYARALDLGYANRANLLARMAETARASGDAAAFASYLETAARENPSDPAVSILEAEGFDDGDAQLERLAKAEETNSEEGALLAVARAKAHLLERRYSEAHREVTRAQELDPRSLIVREIAATTVLFEERERVGASPNVEKLREARQEYLDLRSTLLRLGRLGEAASLLGRAVEASFVAGERRQARELLEEIAGDEGLALLETEPRVQLAEHAMSLLLPDVAKRLLPGDAHSETARLIRATVATLDPGDPSVLDNAVSQLDRLLIETADDGIRGQAAISRLGAACENQSVDWSDDAEAALVTLNRPEIAKGLKAQFLRSRGNRDEAEALLLTLDDPRALDILVNSALDAGDFDLAVSRAERALAAAPSPSRRVEYAEVLIRAGREQDARAVLAAIRSDRDAPQDVRAKAYYLSVREAHQARRYEDARALAEEWMELEPGEEGAAWMRVDALLWLGRASDAIAVARAAGLAPSSVGEARLLAHVYLRGAPPAEAVREIVELSDQFNRSDETLEGLVVVAWTEARESVDEELERRAASSMVEFSERFPDSRAMSRAVSIDELSGLLQLQAAHANELAAMGTDVVAGRIPVSLWAQAAGRSVTQMWSALRILPVTFQQQTAEAEAAETAFGRGAVWDPSALAINAILDDSTRAALRRALPRSVIAQAVIQDADYAAASAVDERAAEDELRMGWDPELGQPVAFVRPAADVERERQLVREALRIAHELEVLPDVSAERPTSADHLVPEISNLHEMVQATVTATLAVGLREALPIYSDDRVLRGLFREGGVPATGAVALVELLETRGVITPSQRQQALADLAAAGAIDLTSTD